MKTRLATSFGPLGAAFLLASAAAAQDEPAGLMKQEAATGGATDVASGGFEAPVEAEADAKDNTEANISAGALLTTGNARSFAATGAALTTARAKGPR
ncbi:MAG TPA: hypothetical protein PKA88_24790, partial [Polyangiaceae bacterium]|nr:hypothetical protein [Polyangiaceae bacterium]